MGPQGEPVSFLPWAAPESTSAAARRGPPEVAQTGDRNVNSKERRRRRQAVDELESQESPAAPLEDGPMESGVSVQLNDFVGEHGAYQLAITTLLFVRYVLLGLMANSGPLMTPDVTFYCELPMAEILLIMPNISTLAAHEQELEIKEEFKQICQIDLHLYQNHTQLANLTHTKSQAKTTPLIVAAGQQRQQQVARAMTGGGLSELWRGNLTAAAAETAGQRSPVGADLATAAAAAAAAAATGATSTSAIGNSGQDSTAAVARIRECTDFTYQMAPDQGLTMTNEFDLVCDRDFLRSLFQSLLSASIVVAHVFWGTFSDKYGRFQAQRICLVVSLLAGLLSVFALDFWTFTLMRALCSFGDLGMVVSLTTTVVELVGSRYRGLSVALVNFGYALGVSLLPYVVAYFENFRLVVGFTVLCHALTMPFVLATNESVRWLLTNRKFKQARRELKRISRWNRSCLQLWASFKRCGLGGSGGGGGGGGEPRSVIETLAAPATAAKDDLHPSEQQRQQRAAFELLFSEFIAQIESQNMCDPSATNGDHQQANSPALLKRPPASLPTISVPISIPSDKQHAPSGAQIEPAQTAHASDRPIFTNIRELSSATSSSSSLESGRGDARAQMRPLPLSEGGRVFSSCNHIERVDAQTGHDQEPIDSPCWPNRDGDQRRRASQSPVGLESRRQQLLEAKLKTLTLPAMSRESSFCEENSAAVVAAAAAGTLERRRRRLESWNWERARARPSAGKRQQPDCINLVAHQLSFMGRVNGLFRDKKLMICVFTIVWTTFNSELLYTSFIIINLEVGEDVYLNYILGGCMEALAAIMASLLLSYSPRRVSLIAFWLLISFSCFGLSLAHIDSHWAVWMLALAKFSQSSLSSIASVAAYESFPTFLRQSGSGLVFTLGMLGSVFAPFIFAEFDDHAGMDRVLMTFSFSSLTAAILIYLYLNETRNCELQ